MLTKILLATLLICSSAHAEIRQVSDLESVRKEVYNSTKETFVIFDVDLTLIEPKDQIFSHSSSQEFNSRYQALKKQHTEDELHHLWSTILVSSPATTVEEDTLSVLRKIQKRNRNVILLTAFETGRLGKIDSLENWRIAELKRMGFNLNISFPETTYHQLDPFLKTTKANCSPLFKHGILFGCFLDKGDVLDAYLSYIKVKPKKIIFVDDRLENVESLAAYCKRENIEFVGFEYTAWKNRKVLPCNPQITQLQFEVLDKGGVWLNDEKAKQVLASLKCANK